MKIKNLIQSGTFCLILMSAGSAGADSATVCNTSITLPSKPASPQSVSIAWTYKGTTENCVSVPKSIAPSTTISISGVASCFTGSYVTNNNCTAAAGPMNCTATLSAVTNVAQPYMALSCYCNLISVQGCGNYTRLQLWQNASSAYAKMITNSKYYTSYCSPYCSGSMCFKANYSSFTYYLNLLNSLPSNCP